LDLDLPHNFRACLDSVQEVSNLLVPEAVKLFIGRL
jgi:hypothetical protein